MFGRFGFCYSEVREAKKVLRKTKKKLYHKHGNDGRSSMVNESLIIIDYQKLLILCELVLNYETPQKSWIQPEITSIGPTKCLINDI